MTSSVHARLASSARPLALAVGLLSLVLVGAACGNGDKGGTPESAPPAASSAKITVVVTVGAPSPEGRRDGSARIDTDAALTNVQLDFETPEACQRVAGAATRKIAAMQAGQSLSQGVGLQCPAGTTGVLRVKVTAKDAQQQTVEASGETAL